MQYRADAAIEPRKKDVKQALGRANRVSRTSKFGRAKAAGGTLTQRGDADEALMVRYQSGDVRAFEILLGRHKKPIFNFILRFVRSRELAEDLTQDTFLRVIKGAANYKKQAKFTTWLYTIARNLCVDQSRRAKHRKAASLDQPMSKSDDAGTLLDVLPDKGIGTDRAAVSRELHRRMESAISGLSEEQREVFLMREFLNMPFKEIADVVGVPENTVKSRMRYALEKLRLELDEFKEVAKVLPAGSA